MKLSFLSIGVLFSLSSFTLPAYAVDDGWCVMSAGFTIQTQGVTNDNVWLKGHFKNETNTHWIKISSNGSGLANVSVVLAAMMSSKEIKIHSPEYLACVDIPSWYAGIDKLEIF